MIPNETEATSLNEDFFATHFSEDGSVLKQSTTFDLIDKIIFY